MKNLFFKLILLFFTLLGGFAFAEDPELLTIDIPGDNPLRMDQNIPGSWYLKCQVDTMANKRYCSIRQELSESSFSQTSDLVIFYEKDKISLSLLGNSYPGEELIIKIDDHLPIFFSKTLELEANNLAFKQLNEGQYIHTRWYDWPNKRQKDQKLSLSGLKLAMDTAEAVINNKTLPIDSNTAEIAAYELCHMLVWLRDLQASRQSVKPEYIEATQLLEKFRGEISPQYKPILEKELTRASTAPKDVFLNREERQGALEGLRMRLKGIQLLP